MSVVSVNTKNVFENSKGTESYLGKIEFTRPDGKVVQRDAQFWKSVYDKGGYEGATDAVVTEVPQEDGTNKYYINVTPTFAGGRAEAEDFDFSEVTIKDAVAA